MKSKERETAHVVVDMLYDFIEGSLACSNSYNAVEKSIEFINQNELHKVFYIKDSHPSDHCSFNENGGVWPPHCVSGTKGAEIHPDFYSKIIDIKSHPQESNTFKKGENPGQEQYSGFEACSSNGERLGDYLKKYGFKHIVISGIASEYCVFETSKDLLNSGFKVSVLHEALAYVDIEGHKESMKKLREIGAEIIN